MIKINKTQNYKDKLVCEGILKLTDSKPIVISKSEKIEVGDWFLADNKFIVKCISSGESFINGNFYRSKCVKILALPEYFSPEQLAQIVSGELKDGNKVLVECEKQKYTNAGNTGQQIEDGGFRNCEINIIKLNPHITIYPPVEEKMYTREEMKQLFISLLETKKDIIVKHQLGLKINDHAFNKWFEQNVK